MSSNLSVDSRNSVFTSANTWLVILSVVTIIVTVWNMWKLWQDGAQQTPWMSWIANVVMFVVALAAFFMWATDALVCVKPLEVVKGKKTFRSNE